MCAKKAPHGCQGVERAVRGETGGVRRGLCWRCMPPKAAVCGRMIPTAGSAGINSADAAPVQGAAKAGAGRNAARIAGIRAAVAAGHADAADTARPQAVGEGGAEAVKKGICTYKIPHTIK